MWEIWALATILISIIFAIVYDDGRYTAILLLALLGRLIIIPIFPMISQADIADYQPYFKQFAALMERGGLFWTLQTFIGRHVPFYTTLYPGYIYAVFGDHGLVLIRIINSCLSVTVLPLFNAINRVIFYRRIKRWQAAIVLFWPSYMFFSVEVGRTVVGILFVGVIFYSFIQLSKNYSIKFLLLFLSSSMATTMTRVYYVIYPLGLLASLYIYKLYISENKRVHAASATIIVTVLFFVGRYLAPYEFSLVRINSLARGIAHGDSAYLTTLYPGSWPDLIWYTPLQGIYFQFSPFLWDLLRISEPLVIVAFFQSHFAILLLILFGSKIQSRLVNWKLAIVILALLIMPFSLGLGVKNTGSAMRWRLPTELLLLTLTSTIVDYEYLSDD